MTKRKSHDKQSWRYDVVNKTIETVHDVFKKAHLTFVEQTVILQWFECYLNYELAKVAANDLFMNLDAVNQKVPDPPKHMPGVA